MTKATVLVVMALILSAAAPDPSEARVVRFVVEQAPRLFADGKSFGDVGSFERLEGTVYLDAGFVKTVEQAARSLV